MEKISVNQYEPNQKWTDHHKSYIATIAKKANINVLYFDYSSELNNMMGSWNIFLNQNQPAEKILEDFCKLLKIYEDHHKKL